jgi:osmotically-inducible protein OsmY
MVDQSRWDERRAQHEYDRYADEGYRGRDPSGRSYGAPTHDLRARQYPYDDQRGYGDVADEGRVFGSSGDYDAAPYGFGAGYGREGNRGGGRDWWDRTRDELATWFGSRGAERRREWDEVRGQHRGRGPRGYKRADERIREDVNDHLTDDPWLDASDVEVTVSDSEVTLTGVVSSRHDKRRAEDLADAVSGVTHGQNNLRLQSPTSSSAGSPAGA